MDLGISIFTASSTLETGCLQERGVKNNTMIKKIILSIAFLLSIKTVNAQVMSDYENFNRSLLSIITSQVHLTNNCTPIAFLIKVEVDDAKRITGISLSDSADSLLRMDFEKNKKSLDTFSLQHFLERKYANTHVTSFIIPFTLTLRDMQRPNQRIDMTVFSKYYTFQGIALGGPCTFFPPSNITKTISR